MILKFYMIFFIKEYNKKMGKSIKGLSESVKKIFKTYSWPGNIRELKNVIEASFNLASNDMIMVEDLPDYIFSVRGHNRLNTDFKSGEKSLAELVDNYEKSIIEKVLKDTKNVTEAAETLKISRQSLNYKLLKYNLK